MTYDEFKENFLAEFPKNKSFAGRIRYTNEHLGKPIGGGSSRVVYPIDNEKVFKLAKNDKGIAQNEAEIDARNIDVIAEIFDFDDDGEWIAVEKAKPVNEKRIIELTGIPSLNDIFHYLRNVENSGTGEFNKGKRVFQQDEETINFFRNNLFTNELENFISNYSQSAKDLGRPSSYGEVVRDGKPAIVLTDYGLSTDVYNTHYNPMREQKYRVQEMYNFADGNDDMLSDIGNTGEVRHGMWALMPYGVGDGTGVINEDFISFVLNRDKYPTRDLPSAPYIVDEFHNVINNLNEVLDNVQEKKKFYNNLLELQDYLIRRKFFEREPLEKEMVELDEAGVPKVEPMQLDTGYAIGLAKAFAQKMNLGEPQHLGGGGYGEAFLINGNRVLKLTTDLCEVDAGGKTKRAGAKTLVNVYKIYKIVDTEQNKAVYALIEDFIADKPYEEFLRLQEVINSLDTSGNEEKGLYYYLLDILVRGRSKVTPEFKGKGIDDFPELAKTILTNLPEANVSQADREKAYQYMMGLYAIKMELNKLNIKSTDFMTTKNLGYKNGVLTYFDIGGCVVNEPQIPSQDVISLPEGEELLDETYDRKTADVIANKVAEMQGYNTPQYIDGGLFGVAYDIGDNKILKVTKDNSEAHENLELIGKPLKYIAQPYKVFSIKAKEGGRETYVIILEKLKTDEEYFKRLKNRMNTVFDQILNEKFEDVLFHYINDDSDFYDKPRVEKYLSKNPEDAKFFYGLVNIGKEAKQYGVESKDFVGMGNLGYKPNGDLGFFDVGFGNGFAVPRGAENIEVNEDGTSKFSYDNSVGRDEFPVHNNMDTSPMIDNNIPTSVNEDLEYNHVVGDATQDEFQLTERVKSSMPGSSAVEVKKKCRLAGNGNTSTACNQGDIGNLNLTSINEQDSIGYDYDKEFPIIAGNEISGLTIRKEIPNMSSIEASLNDYETLNGIREVSFSNSFPDYPLEPKSYSPQENERTKKLAQEIDYNKEITPLIVVIDNEGAYILEGGHRFDALRILGIDRFPAKIVLDLESLNKSKTMNEAQLMSLQDLPFKKEVEQLGGKIFSVGGAVRDEFLGKESKDLDVLISGIPMDELEQILGKYGRVDAVGKSFGVLKFRPKGGEEIDIAIPRTEKPTNVEDINKEIVSIKQQMIDANPSDIENYDEWFMKLNKRLQLLQGQKVGGHQGFDVKSDHALPIEKDLERRDFTINAIAKDTDGNIIDPYGGQKDLKDKIIRIVNPEAFSDDPLRMLRAVQFASRFGFTIEPETMKMIQSNASRVKEIAPERILTEFDKIIKKGNIMTGVQILINTGLYAQIFGGTENTVNPLFTKIKTMGEFIYLLSKNIIANPSNYFKNNLKGDIDTFKEIRAYEEAYNSGEATNLIEARSVAHNMYLWSPQSLQSQILPPVIQTAAQELLSGKYPKTIGELAVNGNDLMSLGLKGKEIGDALKMMLLKIYSGKIRNNKEELLSLLPSKGSVDEFSYPEFKEPKNTWEVNGQEVDINFFVRKYDEWNADERFRDPSKESVLRFLEDEFVDLVQDEILRKELLWTLTDRDVLNEAKKNGKRSI